MNNFDKLGSGIIPDRFLKQFINKGLIQHASLDRVQPSSLDVLPDLNTIFEIDQFYPPKKGEKIETILKELCSQKVARELKGTTMLSKKKRYLIPLIEKINGVPFFARNNPKSSPGRLFAHTRLLTDGVDKYDELYPFEQGGRQWLVVTTKTTCITLRESEPICQLRFFKGSNRLSSKDLEREMCFNPFIQISNQPTLFSVDNPVSITGSAIGAHVLTVDMDCDIVAYKTINTDESVDIGERSLDWRKFFEPVYKDQIKNNRLLLEEGSGYLVGSFERIFLPNNIAGEVSPYVDKYGELRSHFAGYIDNGFGKSHGNSITFEVITHEKGVCIRHRQPIGEIFYEYLAEKSESIYQGNYVKQLSGPQLPKYFKK